MSGSMYVDYSDTIKSNKGLIKEVVITGMKVTPFPMNFTGPCVRVQLVAVGLDQPDPLLLTIHETTALIRSLQDAVKALTKE